jgi:DNA-nicking Smr family endonuclease
VGKNKRPRRGSGQADPPKALERPPERLASPFKDSLSGLKKQLAETEAKQIEAAKAAATKIAAPKATPTKPSRSARAALEDEQTALSLAMHGVVPLGEGKRRRVTNTEPVPSRTKELSHIAPRAEDEARARLDALVAQDVKFRIERDRDYVSAMRLNEPSRLLRELGLRTRADESLDLHGMNQRQAREEVASFVRKMHRRGLDLLCIVHGKGIHSEDGVGVLREVAVDALLQTGAAPLVRAFVTAPDALGGSGALLVLLQR